MFFLFALTFICFAAPVEVHIMYEAYCEYSQQFMLQQLEPALQKIGDIMDVTLIPFGNAQMRKDGVSCQHGDGECDAMKWSNCAIELYPEFDQHWPFIYCQMNNNQHANAEIPKCAKQAGLNYAKLEMCYIEDGEDLLVAAGQRTRRNPGTPSIVLNGSPELRATNSLMWEVCKAYSGSMLPKGCFDAEASPSHTYSITPRGSKLLKSLI